MTKREMKKLTRKIDIHQLCAWYAAYDFNCSLEDIPYLLYMLENDTPLMRTNAIREELGILMKGMDVDLYETLVAILL